MLKVLPRSVIVQCTLYISL